MNRLNGSRSQRSLFLRTSLVGALALTIFSVDARAAMLAARITVTGTTNATTVGTVTNQTAGSPTLFAATDPSNFGDITLRLGQPTTLGGGTGFNQATGVIIATPNQFQYAAVGDRNIIETPGELTNATGGFFQNIYLSTTKVSSTGAEANFKLAMAHFPFAQNWVGGHVQGTTGAFLAGNTASVTVTKILDPVEDPPVVVFGDGHYTLSIAGVDSRRDGMLFAQGDMNSSSGNVVPVGILPDGSGWDVRVNDQGTNFPLTVPSTETQYDWGFVYIPYHGTKNLVAAGELRLVSVEGVGPSIQTLNPVGTFTASRVDLGVNSSITPPTAADGSIDAGRFLITIPGKTDQTGYLMVGVSKYATSGDNSGADDNFLTWEYDAGLGGFLVETYDFAGANLQDSDIYFAYFDYDRPLEIPEPSSVALALLACLGLIGWVRHQK